MTRLNLSDMIDPTQSLTFEDWIDRVEDIALDHGDFEPLGPDHSAVLIENGPNLLVTFENADELRTISEKDVPLGWQLADAHGWSQLCIMSHGQSWFRHEAIYQYFDRQVDRGLFDDYDNIVFYGAGPCGYAAAAYSVAAPGARVLLVSPQATLEPRLTAWDNRFLGARRMDFTSRYGFGPHMTDAAAEVFLFYDPSEAEDAMHAALFHGENVRHVPCRHLDGQIDDFLRRMNLLEGLIMMAIRGRLTGNIVNRALRERRNYLPYLRRLLHVTEGADRPMLSALLCRAVLQRINAPRFRRQLGVAKHQLAAEGRALPPARGAGA